MKAGFVTETHVVIYCDGCGDHYSENQNDSICFHSVSQAIAYITAKSAGVGWVYDGDRIWCDGCLAALHCIEHGHTYTDPRLSAVWPLAKFTHPRTCTVCGVSETEDES